MVKHIESWDVEPGKVVKQLLRPARRKTEGRAETFMLALSEGDFGGMWLSASDVALKAALPVVAISLLTKAATGHGLPVRKAVVPARLFLGHQSGHVEMCMWFQITELH